MGPLHLRVAMDSKAPATAAPPASSSSNIVSASRRRPYKLLSIPLILILGAYLLYPWPTDRQPQPFRKSAVFYNCDPDEPVKRVAVIGTVPRPPKLASPMKSNTSTVQRRRVGRFFSRLLPLQIHTSMQSSQCHHLRAFILHWRPIDYRKCLRLPL